MLSREYGELAGAGGVKDAVRQLAETLALDGTHDVRVVLPFYGFIDGAREGFTPLEDPLIPGRPLEFTIDMPYGLEERRELCRVHQALRLGVRLYLIEAERFGEKGSVYTYTDEESRREGWKRSGSGHYDYFAMNVLLQKSALELMLLLDERPDVIHCHDGHTAIVPALIRECPGFRSYFRDSGCLVTIHNAGMGYHQEVADMPFATSITGLPWRVVAGCLLNGKFDPFLVAGRYGLVNTVSENYARELQETDEDWRTDWLGHALLERGVRIAGITNGISREDYDARDREQFGLAAGYDLTDPADDLNGKRQCKEALLAALAEESSRPGVEQYGRLALGPGAPLFAFIGRLSEQKGVDLLLTAVQAAFSKDSEAGMVILGSGGELLEANLISLAEREGLAGRVCFLRGYDPGLAVQVYAASDFFVIPSRFEPCGLTDFIAQLYGSLPVVHHVGGLVKVIDGETGFAYTEESAQALQEAMLRAKDAFGETGLLRAMQKRAVDVIDQKYTWKRVVEQYRELYQRAKRQTH